ncbi:hypothetical protein C3K47_03510 [Solitalea longa]|uniref:Ricin B lectin domain-containing protein n=1 Tax=Solitalea longa TaxID=2079460 RepID=A0A2S5A8N7_9SPHI|nr:RICIN domain-containing protein [Solitalea longa]POY38473.1 hypothetical protein C3K47_03510 [Solitalea longa]
MKKLITLKLHLASAIMLLSFNLTQAQDFKKLDFDPQRDGFHFPNNFVNYPRTLNTKGLCGGMSLAVFNYWRSKIPVPTHDNSGNYWSGEVIDGKRINECVPPENSALWGYIFGLQLSSYASYSRTVVLPGFDTDENHFNWSLGDEFPRIVQAINQGKFVLLGLRNAVAGVLLGHQVLVYGYDKRYNRIFIYDPNFNDQQILIDLDIKSRTLIHKYANGAPTGNNYRSYFVALELDPNSTDVFTASSRPTYTDIVTLGAPTVTNPPSSSTGKRIYGDGIQISLRARNIGAFPSNVRSFFIRAITPDNRIYDFPMQSSIGNLNIIAAQIEFTLNTSIPVFGNMAGAYQLIPMYYNKFGVPIRMCLNDLTLNNIGIVEMVDKTETKNSSPFATPAVYRMNTVFSGKAVEVESSCFSNGRKVQQFSQNNADGPCAPDGTQQQWKIALDAAGSAQFRVINMKYGKCLDIENNNLVVSDRSNNSTQFWFLERAAEGQYYIKSAGNGRYIQVNTMNNGEALTLGGSAPSGINNLFKITTVQ